MENETIAFYEEKGILNLEKIINKYNSYIYTILRNSISNESDIEEMLSDVFFVFWKNYKRLDDKTEIKEYLAGITKNLIKKKYRNSNLNIENIELYENNIFDNINLEELVENNEKSKVISFTLENIKKTDKDVFIMFYYNQQKIKDISKLLNISEAKVKIILYRTRKLIKKNLKERGYSYGK